MNAPDARTWTSVSWFSTAGLNPDGDARDAVAAVETPVFDGLRDRGAFGTLDTHGRRVGLPE